MQQVDRPLTVPPPGYTLTVTPSTVVLGTGQTAHLMVTVDAGKRLLGRSNADLHETAERVCLHLRGGGDSSRRRHNDAGGEHDGAARLRVRRALWRFAASLRGPGSATGTPKVLRYAGATLAGLFLLVLPVRRRASMKGLVALAMKGLIALTIIGGFAGLGGCGSNCTDFGTSPGSYTFKVNGAAANSTPVVTTGTTPGGGTATPDVSTNVSLRIKL